MHASGIDVVASQFSRSAVNVSTGVASLRRHYAHLLATRAAALAPRRTGHYASTFQSDDDSAWTDEPYAARLEYGYHGPDSLGRLFSQGPRAHWGPATDATEEQFDNAVFALIGAI